MRHILILDANISFAVSIKHALEATGNYSTRSVTRIRPAVDALENQPYDVAVIDTVLAFADLPEAVARLREIQPNLLVIISSANEDDRQYLPLLKAQAFITKPYVARMLIPLIEQTIAAGFEITQHSLPPSLLEEQDRQEIVEPMLQATRRNPSTLLEEPLLSNEDSTISEIIENALNPEVSQKIYATLDPEPLPDHSTIPLASPDPQAENSPASETLALTNGAEALDTLLAEIRRLASGEASGRESNKNLFQLPTPRLIEPMVEDEETRLDFIPPPPLLPDQEWIDAQIGDDEIPELVPTSLENMTQQFTAVVDEIIEENLADEAQAERLPSHLLAHYALQLTDFALESSCLGVMITQEQNAVAQAGELDAQTWTYLGQLVYEHWQQAGDSRTRVLYRRLELGEILIYSIQTEHQLTLTLIFSADTSLKVIRRQAARLSQSLQNVSPVLDIQAPPSDPVVIPPPEKPARVAGTYTSYACLWLVEQAKDAINPTAAKFLERWLSEICQAQDWDFQQMQADKLWIYVVLDVPRDTLGSQVAQTLMTGTAERALALDPRQGHESPWAKGYLVQTPPQALSENMIDQFVNFYRNIQ